MPSAGESQEGIKPRMAELWRSGIGGILDYAAEDDVSEEGGPASRGEEHSTVVARTFDYADEAKCDSHMNIFLQSIAAAKHSEGQGFAAIKVPMSALALSNGLSACTFQTPLLIVIQQLH